MLNSPPNSPNDDAARPGIGAPAAGPAGPAEASQPGVKPKKSSGGMFNPQTRFGRFMRGLTRFLGIVVGLFALGMLATYLLLYQPLAQQSAAQQAELAQDRQKISQAQQDLSAARQQVATLSASSGTLSNSVSLAKDRQSLLSALAAVNQARYHLAVGDLAAAHADLVEIPARLAALASAPGAQVQDIRSRLDLATGEMDRDPKTALSDLGILADQLAALESQLPGQ